MQARYENAYVHTLTILKGLYDPALADGCLPDMSPPERSTALQTLLQVLFMPLFWRPSPVSATPLKLPACCASLEPLAALMQGLCYAQQACHLLKVLLSADAGAKKLYACVWDLGTPFALCGVATDHCPFLPQYAAQASDPFFKEALYSTLVDLKATQQLLKMDSPELLSYLRDSGGLPERDATQRGAPIGPLSQRQVNTLLTHPMVTL